MKENLENLDLQFWKWFPQGIKNPSKINYYLNQRSDWLDHKIINRFEELELHKNFGLFAIGGYGKKEIFPASDIDTVSYTHLTLPTSDLV